MLRFLRNALLTGACLLTVSCSPDVNTPDETSSFVDGVVRFQETGGPVADVEVYVTEYGIILDDWPSVVITTRTDNNGEFRMNFTSVIGFNYYIHVGEPFPDNKTFLKRGENQDVVLKVSNRL